MNSVEPIALELGGPMSRTCPTRELMDQLSDKWSICVLLSVSNGPVRFNQLKRTVEGVTQKMLGQTLRRLEANGIVERRAYPTMPMRVEYEITELGRTLMPIVEALQSWAVANFRHVAAARREFANRPAVSTGLGAAA